MKLLAPNREYLEQTSRYTKVDALLAAALCFVCAAILWGVGKITALFEIAKASSSLPITLPYVAILVGLVLIFVRIKKQKLSSIGFNKANMLKSAAVGIFFCVGYVLFMYVGGSRFGALNPEREMPIWMMIYNALIATAFVEELVFRAYVGSRFYGAFKSKFLSILLTGLICAAMHYIVAIASSQMSIAEYFHSDAWQMNNTMFIHTLLHFLFHWHYSKFNSITGPVLVHFFLNFTAYFYIA